MTDANSGAEDAAISTREKYRRISEHRRYPKKKNYSFDDLALGLTAMDAGVNRYYAMHAGKPVKRVLDYLAQATKATKPEIKAKALKLARKCFDELSRDRHPELAEQIENRILWEEGWRPETWDAERSTPKNRSPGINPKTGVQEFFFASPFSQPSDPKPGPTPPQFPTPENPYPNEPEIRPLPNWPESKSPIERLPPPGETVDPNPCKPERIEEARATVEGFRKMSVRLQEIDARLNQATDLYEIDALADERQKILIFIQQNSQRLTEARQLLTACGV